MVLISQSLFCIHHSLKLGIQAEKVIEVRRAAMHGILVHTMRASEQNFGKVGGQVYMVPEQSSI